MTSSVADFYGVPAQGVVQQIDSITLSHTTPAALSKKGIVSYPAKETAQASPTADVITVFDVTTSTALVLGTDYTLTASGTSPETLTYSVLRLNASTASADGNTATVTYRYGITPDQAHDFGDFQGTAGTAPTGTQSRAAVTDTEGASASGMGAAGGYGSLTDPAAGTQSSSETGSPGSEYTVTPRAPGTYGWASGAPDTEGVYGGGLPSSYSPVLGANYSQGNIGSAADPGNLDTTSAGGSNLVPAEYASAPAYRPPTAGVGASVKDTTLTDILGNQQNATASVPPSGYSAAVVDTGYFGAPDQPTAQASQTDIFTAAAAGTRYYLSQQGIIPSSIVITDTTTTPDPTVLVLTTDYTVTTSGNGANTVAYIVPVAGVGFTASDDLSVTYTYGDSQYWGSNVPSSVPGAPGTPTVAAVNRGVKCTWAPPSGFTPVDYYLLQAEDLGTMYVPYTGQPVLSGQPSPSGGGGVGQPTYQADTFTKLIAAALTAPTPTTATAATGGTVAAGTYTVAVTYVNANGESVASATHTQVTSGATSTLTVNSPAASGTATGWYAYVSQADGTTLTRQQAAGVPTAIATNLVLTAPPTSTGAAPPTINTTLPTTRQGVITPPSQIIVRDTTSTEGDPAAPGGTVLEYGYDYTVTQIGIGPWAQYQVKLAAGSQNAFSGDTIIVEYWWGADPSSVIAVFTQGLVENIPVIYKPDGTTYGFQGYRFKVAAGNKAGLGPYSAWSAYSIPLNYSAPQPGHQGTTQTELVLDPANAVNPIYLPDGTVKSGTGLGG